MGNPATYDEVKRAVQEGTRDLQDMARQLRNSHDEIRRTVLQTDTVEGTLADLRQRIQDMQRQLNDNANAMRAVAQLSQTLQAMTRVIEDMQRRVANTEQISHVCYQHLAEMRERQLGPHHP
ncbi:MAG TPA: hypothetical protein VLF60_00070 [Candidatus Saccharimonadales bacterium]|nr:hypothetical protein [Candidatus Saccharimonadales bacterium]